MMSPNPIQSALRKIPPVDELLTEGPIADLLNTYPRDLAVSHIRVILEEIRDAIRGGLDPEAVERITSTTSIAETLAKRLGEKFKPRFCRCINGTGIILHTGIGRAPLAREAREALARELAGYCIVEVNRKSGERNWREESMVDLICELTGAESATVVNNNAAATMLSLAALAAGKEVILARGQIVEIGGAYRMPDVMVQSGARLREVGTTNRVYLRDYEEAIGPDTGLLLKVHTSNFRVMGFFHEVPLSDLVALGRRRGLPVMEDLGSGNLVDLTPCGLPEEPLVQDCVRAGADVVCFSGDKLLGGPQAGVIVGNRDAVERIRKHQLFRALRPGKMTLVALEATLKLYLDRERVFQRSPTLRLITLPLREIEERAEALASELRAAGPDLDVAVVPEHSQTGSGSLPTESLTTRAVAIASPKLTVERLAEALRLNDPPIFVRRKGGTVLLDLRTILPGEEADIVLAVKNICERACKACL
jgi:L-seryl-tRNA(Ser) seleniumtransferase